MGAAFIFRLALPLAYLLAGVTWILGSDALLAHEAGLGVAAQAAASIKGIAFVIVSTLLLYAVQAWPGAAAASARPGASVSSFSSISGAASTGLAAATSAQVTGAGADGAGAGEGEGASPHGR